MTESELRAKYVQAYRIIEQERKTVEHLFRHDPVTLGVKLVELHMLLTIVIEFKDALKEHCVSGPGQEQMALLDPPAKYE